MERNLRDFIAQQEHKNDLHTNYAKEFAKSFNNDNNLGNIPKFPKGDTK